MRILAVGDIHGDKYLDGLRSRLKARSEVDLILLAGDITERNDIDAFRRVLDVIEGFSDAPILAVFGNEEWSESHEEYKRTFPITFLHDEALTLRVADRELRIVGSTGSLDTPTWWQRTNLPNIYREYAERVKVLDSLLDSDDFRILLTHYAPTYKTLVGEGEGYWDQLGSRRLENVVVCRRPELVIHGHAHKGSPYAELRTEQTTLEDYTKTRSIPVYNVAFPVRDDVTFLEV